MSRAEPIAEQYGCEVVSEYRDLLKRPDISVVMLGLPNHLHAPISIEALAAGKHVFVEKPIANTLAETDAMLETAQKHNAKLQGEPAPDKLGAIAGLAAGGAAIDSTSTPPGTQTGAAAFDALGLSG